MRGAPSNPGRNDPCPCGSGRKFKQCCLKGPQPAAPSLHRPFAPQSLQRPKHMENTLYRLYMKEGETFRWFENLDLESARLLLLATWHIMLWNPLNVDKSLLKFYGHAIDGPNVVRFLEMLKRRLAYCETYAWAIPDDEAIATLLEHSPLVEIGAGRGYWAALASSAGADVIAFDPDPPGQAGVNKWHREPGTFFDVQRAGVEVAGSHPERALFLCWPPYDSDVAAAALRNYNGRIVIFVGEKGRDPGLLRFFADLARRFTLARVVDIPRWPGVNDRLEVWRWSDVASRPT